MLFDRGPHRIGEFSRRVGVSPELLRAWERRYGLLQPVRSAGGFRLYTDEDAARVARMRRALGDGLSAAEAARATLKPEPEPEPPPGGVGEDAAARLLAAIRQYDEDAVHAVLDESLAAFSVEAVLRDVILPTLNEVGVAWQNNTLGIGEEHFSSNLIHGRLLSLARLWGRGAGPLAVLACAPREVHDISLIAFGLLLRSHGWRILFLGANTPLATLARTAKTTQPAVIVITAFDPALLHAERTAIRRLANDVPLVLSGPGATDAVSAQLGVPRLDGDVIAAAAEIAQTRV